jgi:hypothetical protein
MTLTLGRDRIVTEGPYYDTGEVAFTITGGTGRYLGAKGMVTARVRDPSPLPNGFGAAYDVVYEIY